MSPSFEEMDQKDENLWNVVKVKVLEDCLESRDLRRSWKKKNYHSILQYLAIACDTTYLEQLSSSKRPMTQT